MKQRVDYKVAVIAYKTRSIGVSSYLSTLITMQADHCARLID